MADQIIQIPPAFLWELSFEPEIIITSAQGIGAVHPPGLNKGDKAYLNTRNVGLVGARVYIDDIEMTVTDDTQASHLEFTSNTDAYGEIFIVVLPVSPDPIWWDVSVHLQWGDLQHKYQSHNAAHTAHFVYYDLDGAGSGGPVRDVVNYKFAPAGLTRGSAGGWGYWGHDDADSFGTDFVAKFKWWVDGGCFDFWFKLDAGTYAASGPIISGWAADVMMWQLLIHHTTGIMTFECQDASGLQSESFSSGFTDAVFEHAFFKYDVDSTTLFLGLDGAQESFSFPYSPSTAVDEIRFFGNTVVDEQHPGTIDEVLYIQNSDRFGIGSAYLIPLTAYPVVWSSLTNPVPYFNAGASCGTLNAGLAISGYDTGVASTNCWDIINEIWTAAGAINSAAGYFLGGCGTATAALYTSGNDAAHDAHDDSEEYNGTTWGSAATYTGGARNSTGTVGTVSAAMTFGGNPDGAPTVTAAVSDYNGTTWTTGVSLIYARSEMKGAGTANDCTILGGHVYQTFGFNGSSWTALPDTTQQSDKRGCCGTADDFVAIGSHEGISYVYAYTTIWDSVAWTDTAPKLYQGAGGADQGTSQSAYSGGGGPSTVGLRYACEYSGTYRNWDYT
jgi:hypothetical protein